MMFMLSKFVWFMTLLAFIRSDGNDDDDIMINVQKPRQLDVYAYNHPPIFELDDIPVKNNHKIQIREAKSNKFGSSVKLGDNLKFETSASPSQNVKFESSTPKENNNPTVNKVRRRKLRKPQAKKENTLVSSTPNYSGEKDRSVTKLIQQTTPVTTTITPIGKITLQSSSIPKTFPKRPEADSKRIAFQRRSHENGPVVKILNEQNFVYAHTGNFHYSYDTADGTKISSRGKLIDDGREKAGEAVEGSVSYKDLDGKDFSLSYTADENGYRPVGSHLPTPPPVPAAIARALQYLATKSTPESITEASR